MKVARLSNIVGLRRDPDMFIDQLLDEGCRTGKVVLRTAPESRKDYLYIDDAVGLLERIALSGEAGIYNVASGEAVTNGEIIRALAEHMDFEVSVAPGAPVWNFTAIDISKARNRFGFAPARFSEYFPVFLGDYRRNNGAAGGRSQQA